MSTYSYNKAQLLWYRNNDSNDKVYIDLGPSSITTSKDFNPANNKLGIKIVDLDIFYSGGVFLPQEGDKMFVYAKEVTKANESDFVESDIIWNGKFVDKGRDESEDGITLSLNILDWGYDVFNLFHKESYLNLGLRTNAAIVRLIHTATENDDRTFRIDTTNIVSTRNDGSLFPVIEYPGTLKPHYEVFDEISQPQWTNAFGESVIDYPMILDFRGIYAYWYEQPLNEVMTINDTTIIVSLKDATNNEGSATRLILEVGEDLNGDPIHTYIVDESAKSEIVKESFKKEIKLAGENNTYDNEYNDLRAKAVSLGWSNSTFRSEARTLAKSFAETWFKTVGRKPQEITVTLPRVSINLGELINVQRKRVPSGLYRVVSIKESISTKDWTSTLGLQLFED